MEAASSSEWVVLGSWQSLGSSVFRWWIPQARQAGRILSLSSQGLGSVTYGYAVMATAGWHTPTCTAQHTLADVPDHILQASFHTNPSHPSLCGADHPPQSIGLLHQSIHTPPGYSIITVYPMGPSLQSNCDSLASIRLLHLLHLILGHPGHRLLSQHCLA